ncbi:MAG: transcriptional repressor NrdR [Candidatus Aureabacteria bacterium]|nr:transcriptional repressor NrdR [Candidatus Auribacterota bacterium]MCK5655484.1 transcriptional repressor NrdR [Candidatus Auribacterota bacterium]
MRCPYCDYEEDKVVDSRSSNDGKVIRRRRECLKCSKRFTTYERVEKVPISVVKKGNIREDFDRNKIFEGVLKACQKRPIGIDRIEQLVDEVEQELETEGRKEIKSEKIGELVMNKLQLLDDVAYVRFASVYRQFKDVNQFMSEITGILGEGKKNDKRG